MEKDKNLDLTNLKESINNFSEVIINNFHELLQENQNLKNNNQDFNNSKQLSYGLTNLGRLKEEAIFDAINFFDKKCPYCGKGLYEGNIRKKIEIDHFFPIAKGGQDFPWNLLPTCKSCNRKKRDFMPYEFLKFDIYSSCFNYLNDVKFKITKTHDDSLQKESMVSNLVNKFQKKNISKNQLVKDLLGIYGFIEEEKINTIYEKQTNELKNLLIDFFLNVGVMNGNLEVAPIDIKKRWFEKDSKMTNTILKLILSQDFGFEKNERVIRYNPFYEASSKTGTPFIINPNDFMNKFKL